MKWIEHRRDENKCEKNEFHSTFVCVLFWIISISLILWNNKCKQIGKSKEWRKKTIQWNKNDTNWRWWRKIMHGIRAHKMFTIEWKKKWISFRYFVIFLVFLHRQISKSKCKRFWMPNDMIEYTAFLFLLLHLYTWVVFFLLLYVSLSALHVQHNICIRSQYMLKHNWFLLLLTQIQWAYKGSRCFT